MVRGGWRPTSPFKLKLYFFKLPSNIKSYEGKAKISRCNMSGNFQILSGKCQGIVRNFHFRWFVATLFMVMFFTYCTNSLSAYRRQKTAWKKKIQHIFSPFRKMRTKPSLGC